jgi:hypothetical protein
MTLATSRILIVATLAVTTGLLTACAPTLPPLPTVPTPTETTASPVAGTAECTTDNLSITYAATDNTAGHEHGILTFTNSHGDTTCGMNGYPSAYFSHPEAFSAMGAVSTNDTVTVPSLVVLAPGDHAQAAVTITRAEIVEGCTVVTATALLVAPPLSHPANFGELGDAQHVDIADTSACNNASISLLAIAAVTAA